MLQRKGQLVALVNSNEETIDWNHETEAEILAKLDKHRSRILSIVNGNVKKASRISRIEFLREPFKKTATKKIRRFKYAEVKGF